MRPCFWLAYLPYLIAAANATELPADLPVELPVERLDPPTRTAVMMALLGLVLLGLLLVACIMVGGRWLRRLARQRRPPREWPRKQQPWEEPIATDAAAPDSAELPDERRLLGETMIDKPPEDTVAD
ncbi:MAG: hypothetical protein AAGF31_03835 [Planctomycetota bacterium]